MPFGRDKSLNYPNLLGEISHTDWIESCLSKQYNILRNYLTNDCCVIYFIDFANKTVMGSASKHHNNMRRTGLCNVKYYFNNSNSGISSEKANKTIGVYMTVWSDHNVDIWPTSSPHRYKKTQKHLNCPAYKNRMVNAENVFWKKNTTQ